MFSDYFYQYVCWFMTYPKDGKTNKAVAKDVRIQLKQGCQNTTEMLLAFQYRVKWASFSILTLSRIRSHVEAPQIDKF